MSAPSDDDRDVLSSLPRSRPARRSAKRDGAAKPKPTPAAATAKPAAAKPKPKPKAAAAKPKPKTPAKAAAKPAAKAKPRTTAAKPRSKPAAAKAKAKPKAEGAADVRSIASAPSAAARQAETPSVPPAGWSTPEPTKQQGSPDLLTTAVQAATEVVQLSSAVGKQVAKAVLGRLPRP